MICQGCGKEVEPNERHTYYSCLAWIRWHPEAVAKVTHKHLYYGRVVPEESKEAKVMTEKTREQIQKECADEVCKQLRRNREEHANLVRELRHIYKE